MQSPAPGQGKRRQHHARGRPAARSLPALTKGQSWPETEDWSSQLKPQQLFLSLLTLLLVLSLRVRLELRPGWEQPGAGAGGSWSPGWALPGPSPLCENSSSGKTGIQFTK